MIEKTKIVFAADLILIKIIGLVWQFQNSQTMNLKFKKILWKRVASILSFCLYFNLPHLKSNYDLH